MVKQKTTADLIKSAWSTMTATDRKVARVLLSHYPTVGLETLAGVSEKADVSAPSVIRCIKKLGFGGYPEYQKALHAEIADLLADCNHTETASGNWHLPDRVQKQYDDVRNATQQTFSLLHEAELVGAARLIADDGKRVSVVGGVLSTPLADVLFQRLMTLRPNCNLLSADPLKRSQRLIDVDKRDVIVAFDLQPFDTDLAAFARLASERGAQIVVFTDSDMSSITEAARFVFVAAARGVALAANTMAVCLAELLLAEVQRIIGKPADERLRQLHEARIR
jgi:DNA-binding MurR/RpiR family transcriptional regulator